MKEGEPIKSRMAMRRIQKELEKIAKISSGDAPANPVEEWLERNGVDTQQASLVGNSRGRHTLRAVTGADGTRSAPATFW
jgi:hypothetical protein